MKFLPRLTLRLKQIDPRSLTNLLLCFLVLVMGFQQLPLHSREIFNTGAFACTRQKVLQTQTWHVTVPTLVRKGQLWMGMNGGTIADFGFMLVRDRDNTFLFRGNWDHYAEPSGINDQIMDMDLSPDYILLLPGDNVTLYYHCQSFGLTLGAGHVIVNLWMFP
jgi:hypothetical protein